MQGGQGDIKHWAFNDPAQAGREIPTNRPPTPAEYRKLATRVVELHPVTLSQNARTSGGGNITMVPPQAITVGPRETWMADKVSIWHAGVHDNPLGQRLTALMISQGPGRFGRAHVAAGRSSERAVQLLPRRPRHLRGGDALSDSFITTKDRVLLPRT